VIVGVGQVNRPPESTDGPIALAVEALTLAARDSGAGDALLRNATSVRHVATTCWPYCDEAALIADELGVQPRETVRTAQFGGDGPQRLVSDTAEAIAAGRLDVALLSGAEAMAALRSSQRGGAMPSWPEQPSNVAPSRVLGSDRLPSNEAEMAVGLMAPVYNYALLETAVQARAGADRAPHLQSVAALWSRFAAVAQDNPHARLPRHVSADELLAESEGNRAVSAPYRKLMTANIQVDQATGIIMCSAEAAEAAGVPLDRLVFVVAGAHAADEWFLSERAELAASPAITACGVAALEHAGLSIDDVALLDLYSCFPSAVQIGAAALGLQLDDPSRPLTLTGGLTFAGGPGNNYSSHAIATVVDRLRGDPDAFGFTTALGWYATKHACGVYSGRPPATRFRDIDAGADGHGAISRPTPRRASADYSGPATVEAYTVPFGRDGEPEAVIISALAPDGTRALIRCAERDVIDAMLSEDPLGWAVDVSGPGSVSLAAAQTGVEGA
jgi:acetyl-CoA C-acetyltransferase